MPLHPFLFAAASPFSIMASNLDHTSFANVVPSLAGVLLFALIAYLIMVCLRIRFDRTAAVLASIWVVGFLFYADLFGELNRFMDGGYPMVRSLPLALVALLLASGLALVLQRAMPLINPVLNGIAIVVLVTPLWQAVAYEYQNGPARQAYDPGEGLAEIQPQHLDVLDEAEDAARPPDVYHFIFDRYASETILSQHYSLDNSAIGRFLQEHGFYLARSSHSNYQKTGHSLASTFYMDYLDLLEGDPRVQGSNWHPIYKMLRDHRVGRIFKELGYDFVQFGSWWVGTHYNSIADENHPHGFNEFEMIYLRRTVLRPLFHALPNTPLTMRLDWDNAQCQRVRAQIDEIKNVGERESPFYVFAHFLLPHGPYNFARDGSCISQAASAQRGSKQGYIDQIAFANQIIKEIVTSLQGRERPPIIVIQADEGPFPEPPRVPWHEAPADTLRIKTGIMNAYYFPGKDYEALYPDITPVNSYRVLFNTYFDSNLPLLPDRIFAFPGDGILYEFHDVTEKVRGTRDIVGTGPPRYMLP